MHTRKVLVELDEADFAKLSMRAKQEERYVHQQAALLIKRALESDCKRRLCRDSCDTCIDEVNEVNNAD